MKHTLPHLGLGSGWRQELALPIERRRDLGYVEVLAEDLHACAVIPKPLERLRERGVAVIPHGVSLSLGGAEPVDEDRLEALSRLAVRVQAPLVSEHIAFVRAGGVEAGHLLPLPRTAVALETVVVNACRAKEALPVPLALENVATLFEWPDAEMDEAAFLTEVLERADVLLLLDLANVYANAHNHGWDPVQFLERIPLDRLAYVHIAGGIERDGLYHDTHAHAILPAVLDLLEELCARVDAPGVLFEHDDNYPSDAEWNAAMDAIAGAMVRGQRRREEHHALR